MPYIEPERKTILDPYINEVFPQSLGELNYCITRLALNWLERNAKNYTNMQNVHGCMGCAQAEFYRRMLAPYEDIKKGQNGDVYPYYF